MEWHDLESHAAFHRALLGFVLLRIEAIAE
jgi:hypothetical protein